MKLGSCRTAGLGSGLVEKRLRGSCSSVVKERAFVRGERGEEANTRAGATYFLINWHLH